MDHRPAPLPTRRAVLGGALAAAVMPAGAFAATAPTLYAGTYANEGGAGLVPLRAGCSMGHAYAAIRNASFGVRGARHRYLLDEQRDGSVGVYDAAFRRVAVQPTLGADPCHAALSADRALLAVANYSSGSVALWRLDAKGLPQGRAQLVQHEGSGPNKERQAGPHAHWVGFAPGGRVLHSVDLGADAVFAHRLARGAIVATDIAYRAAPGSGPRHLARHPRLPVAYLVTELANDVTRLDARADGTFVARGTVSTLPKGFSGASAAAHIAIDAAGRRLYVSNRGHDSIAVFAIARDGTLTPIQHVPSGGHWPRFFLLRRAEMLVANERSGTIARLTVGADGRLSRARGGCAVPGVVFLGD